MVAQRAEAERATLAELHGARQKAPHSLDRLPPLGRLPLVILTRGVDTDKERMAAYDEMEKISARSRRAVVADAGHEIHVLQPAVVIEAIREAIALSRSM